MRGVVLFTDAVAEALGQASIGVDVAYDGVSALDRLMINSCGVVVLDRDLPEVHGDVVCAEIVAAGAGTRILMLTAASAVPDRVAGLAMGADDYLPKPFDLSELLARVRALGRRSGPARGPVLARADLRLDPHAREVSRGDRLIPLSRKEFAVLEGLLRAEGGAVSTEQLLERAWDENADPFTMSSGSLCSTCAETGDPPIVETVHGVGYQIHDRAVDIRTVPPDPGLRRNLPRRDHHSRTRHVPPGPTLNDRGVPTPELINLKDKRGLDLPPG